MGVRRPCRRRAGVPVERRAGLTGARELLREPPRGDDRRRRLSAQRARPARPRRQRLGVPARRVARVVPVGAGDGSDRRRSGRRRRTADGDGAAGSPWRQQRRLGDQPAHPLARQLRRDQRHRLCRVSLRPPGRLDGCPETPIRGLRGRQVQGSSAKSRPDTRWKGSRLRQTIGRGDYLIAGICLSRSAPQSGHLQGPSQGALLWVERPPGSLTIPLPPC